MKLVLIVICFLVVSCKPDEQNTALINYKCTQEQMKKAESEASFCIEKTSFYSSYCYSSAVIRNCTKN